MRNLLTLFLLLAAWIGAAHGQSSGTSGPIVRTEFIFEKAPFASAHASTIVETKSGLVAAWFGGSHEGAEDVGIWSSRLEKGKWTLPTEIANGKQPDGRRYACWNPVLFQISDRELVLFYKIGVGPQRWWGMEQRSKDGGVTWGAAKRLPDGILGPIKNKPVRLANGSILSPTSTEFFEDPSKWRVHFELSVDNGRTWKLVEPPPAADGSFIDAIQPSILFNPGGGLEAVGRTKAGRIFETWSNDSGETWTPLALTSLPNPNSGIDAVTLIDGRQLIVYNHTKNGRSPLNVSISRDGKTWEAALVLENEPGEYSYPAVIQTSEGLVHITYTWKRQRIKHVILDPKKLRATPINDGKWPG